MAVARNVGQVKRGNARVVRNVAYIKRRKRMAKWSALLGFALLGSSFWLATVRGSSGVVLAYIPLLAGTLLFHFGMQQIARWNSRNDLRLDALLTNLGDRYALIHYVQIGKRVVDHLLVHPGGVLALTAREVPGKVSHRKGRWRKGGAGVGRLFGLGGPQLGNPTFETQQRVDALEAFLAEAQLEAEVDGAIVFVNPLVRLDVEEPDFPVMNGEGLQEYVRALPADATLRPTDRQALVALLAQGEELEQQQAVRRRRPVKRRAA